MAENPKRREIPYGLKVSEDCLHLEDHPQEQEVLAKILESVVADHKLSEIAAQLNEAGSKTRKGQPWSQVDIFNLMPRLVEAGPEILSREDWEARRGRRLRAV